jgi:sarcosine oxidase subunit beta
MQLNSDAIVIGSGVIGSSVAYNLSKRGISVNLIESGTIGCGSSCACDGFVILQSKSPGPHLTMALASEVLYRTLPDELDWDIGYRHCGGMIIIEREEELNAMKIFMSKQQNLGLDVHLLSGDEARKVEPALAPHIVGATICSRDAQVNPMYLVTGYINAAKREGLVVHKNTPVTEITMKSNKITGVIAGGNHFSAGTVICCCGVKTPELLSKLNINLQIKPRRGQLVITEPVEPIINHVMLCSRYIAAKYHPELLENADDDAIRLGVGMALEQTAEGGLLIGSTREFVGFDKNVSEVGIRTVVAHAVRMVPALKKIRMVRAFAGLRPYTPDGKAFMGAVPNYKGLYVAAGHEGDGIAYAPITGKSMAELIVNGKSEANLTPFAVDRKIDKY